MTKLVLNYRSLPCILDFVNKQFYNSELRATVSSSISREAGILSLLFETQAVPRNKTNYAIYFFNIDGKNVKLNTPSWCNLEEAFAVIRRVNQLQRNSFYQQL